MAFALLQPMPGYAADAESELQYSVDELRLAIGDWQVVTEFFAGDGSIAQSVEGTYSFSWIIEDRVASGRNAIPELGLQSGILFYINETARHIEMVAVGKDGRLWIMTGPLGGSTRYSQTYEDSGGGTGQLRFTRYNVTDEGFESRMEYTEDGGETWKPGNHQMFRRAGNAGGKDPQVPGTDVP
jgi:hypothetical protein